MTCKRCGATLEDNAKFCGNCGALIEVDQNIEPLNQEVNLDSVNLYTGLDEPLNPINTNLNIDENSKVEPVLSVPENNSDIDLNNNLNSLPPMPNQTEINNTSTTKDKKGTSKILMVLVALVIILIITVAILIITK